MEYQYPLKFGKYLLTRRIAVGGMAEVFKAKLIGPKGFEKTLALKKILPEFSEDEEFVQMFVDEARISSNLHHGNIVQVFDFGEVHRSYYIAMEYVDGPNLKNLHQRFLKDRGRFPRDFSLHISLQIAQALEYAHNVRIEGRNILNLIHRDVSPQNVLVSRSGEVKITDFGIAKATIKISHTQPGKVQGKLSYMSPEQAAGKVLDRRSDIFSLGVIMYELLSGVKVYAGDDTAQRYSEVREARIPRLATLVPDLPSQLESLVMRMLARDSEDRPQTCGEVIRELGEVMTDIPSTRLSAELGNMINELFPQEKSDSSVGRRLHAMLEGGRTEGEPATDVDLRRVAPLEGPRDAATKPVGAEVTAARRLERRTWFRIFLLFLLAGSVLLWFRYKEKPETPRGAASGTSEDAPEDTDLSLNVSPRSGPADPDLLEAARLRQAEVEAKLEEETARRRQLEEEVQAKDKEIQELAEVAAAPKPPCPSDMVFLPAGTFFFGSDAGDRDRAGYVEREADLISTQRFCIDPYEYPNRKGAEPVAGVAWNEAQALCAKAGKRLCAQEEWERACKGSSVAGGRNPRYPYRSDKYDPLICNTKGEGESEGQKPAPSGSFGRCVTREEVYDLSGNVDEWTQSPGPTAYDGEETRVTKGGSSRRPGYQARCSSLRWVKVAGKEEDIGFRCCKDAI